MFTSLGLFKTITCPNLSDCNLINCLFSHELTPSPVTSSTHDADGNYNVNANGSGNVNGNANGEAVHESQIGPTTKQSSVRTELYDPLSAGITLKVTSSEDIEPPPLKRRRLEAPRPVSKDDDLKSVKSSIVRKDVSSQLKQPTSISRTVSPPPAKRIQQTHALKPQVQEKLIPRQVPKAPTVLKTRLSLLEVLHKHIKILNDRIDRASIDKHWLPLSDQDIIKLALDEEEQVALELSGDIYRNTLSQRVLRFKRMTDKDWEKFVTGKVQPKQPVITRSVPDNRGEPSDLNTGLTSAQEIVLLHHMQTKLEGLEDYGYVTAPPSSIEIKKARDGVESSLGYESCDRCGTRFQVFPGRDDQGRLMTQGQCYYHWAKINRYQSNKQVNMYGQNEPTYPCCNQPAGSEGCTEAESHVFKITDVKRLASILQFEKTPEQNLDQERCPVAFDCEMGYTTYGLELIRLTAVSWPKNQELLDILVRPYGEILDFNTRFSGVSKETFARAADYDDPIAMNESDSEPEDAFKEGEIPPITKPSLLKKVSSPARARQLLFNLLTPSTPLIGHAIDNDLNATRIIHPYIVDTVLLYPHPRGLPIRYGLKMLSQKYLHRGIQQGGAAGHDSKEDSIATGDLVRVKVKEKWEDLRRQGWNWDGSNSTLIEPMKVKTVDKKISRN